MYYRSVEQQEALQECDRKVAQFIEITFFKIKLVESIVSEYDLSHSVNWAMTTRKSRSSDDFVSAIDRIR